MLHQPLDLDCDYRIGSIMELGSQFLSQMKKDVALYDISLTKEMLAEVVLQIVTSSQRPPQPREYTYGFYGDGPVLSYPMHENAGRTGQRSVHQVWVEILDASDEFVELRTFFVVYSRAQGRIISIVPRDMVEVFDACDACA